jgi:hypothetical protein
MTVRRKHFACRVTKATGTHSEYLIQIALPLQQWLRKRASILLYTYIACNINFQNTPCLGTYAPAIPFKPTTNIRQFHGPIDSPSNTSPPVCRTSCSVYWPSVWTFAAASRKFSDLLNAHYSWPHLLLCLASDVRTTASVVRVAHMYSSDCAELGFSSRSWKARENTTTI